MNAIILNKSKLEIILNELKSYNEQICDFLNEEFGRYLYGCERITSVVWEKVSVPGTCYRHQYPTLMVHARLFEGYDNEGKEQVAGGILFVKDDKLAWEESNTLYQFYNDDDYIKEKIRSLLKKWYDYANHYVTNNLAMQSIELK